MTDVTQDNRPSVYTEDDMTVFRFSSLGGCTRALVLSLRGEEPSATPDWMQAKFDQGRRHEDPIIRAWIAEESTKKRMWKMLDPEDMASRRDMPHIVGASHGQFNAEIPVGKDIIIRGKPDGVAQLYGVGTDDWMKNGERVGVEVKAFGASYWDKFQKEGLAGFDHYRTQVTLQMAATGLPVVFVVGRKDETGEFTGEIDWRRVSEPPGSLGAIKAKCISVVRQAEGTLMPACDVNQYPCPYYIFHDEKVEEGVVPLDGENATRMAEWAAAYSKGSGLEKEGKELKKQAWAAMQEWIEARGDKSGEWTYTAGGWKVTDFEYPRKEYVVKEGVVRYPKVGWRE